MYDCKHKKVCQEEESQTQNKEKHIWCTYSCSIQDIEKQLPFPTYIFLSKEKLLEYTYLSHKIAFGPDIELCSK